MARRAVEEVQTLLPKRRDASLAAGIYDSLWPQMQRSLCGTRVTANPSFLVGKQLMLRITCSIYYGQASPGFRTVRQSRTEWRLCWHPPDWNNNIRRSTPLGTAYYGPRTRLANLGTPQVDVSSPAVWVAVFGILLRALEATVSMPYGVKSPESGGTATLLMPA